MKFIKILVPLFLLITTVSYASKIQDQDIKSAAECIAGGATVAGCLPNANKIYVGALGQSLSTAITNGSVANQTEPYLLGQFATPANPAAGSNKLYFKNDNVLYQLTSGGVETALSGNSSPLTTKGDLFTYSVADTRLPVGPDGFFLTADSGQPTGLNWTFASGTGSVTSVGITVPAIFSVFNSPITTAGTISVTANAEPANYVYSGPVVGAPAVPTFRPLVIQDMPASVVGTVITVAARTSQNIPNTLVFRDGSGDFSANVITANLNGNATNITGLAYVGAVPFSNGSILVEDGAHFNWDDFNDNLSITGSITASKTASDVGFADIMFSAISDTTVDGSNTVNALQGVATATVQVGATNDKNVTGSTVTVTRGDGTDDGTLGALGGYGALMFMNSGAAGVTDSTFGVLVLDFEQQGNYNNVYDFAAFTNAGAAVITNHYGVYIGPDTSSPKKSWIADRTTIGGTSFVSPVANLDVRGNVNATDSSTDASRTGINSIILGTINAAPSNIIGQATKAEILVTAPVGSGNALTGASFAAWRDQGATDTDLVDTIYGIEASAAHVNTNASAHTNNIAGLHFGNAALTGTVDNLYDIFADDQGSVGGLITNRYGIYIGNDGPYTKTNWLSGNTTLGQNAFVVPTASLDVNGDARIRDTLALNKEITATQIATPAPGPAGTDKLYFKSDDKLYGQTSGGSEFLIGPSGGGSSSGVTELFVLNGGLSIMDDVDGIRQMQSTGTLTAIVACAYNTGSSGGTTIKANYGSFLENFSFITLTANSGRPGCMRTTPNVTINQNDIMNITVTGVSNGAPEDLTVKFIF